MTQYIKNEAGLLVPFAPHIIKRNHIEGEVSNRATMQGLYKLTVRRSDGSVKQETPWFSNLILDSGLNRLGTAGCAGLCEIGTSTAAPAASQTSLLAFAARTTTFQASSLTRRSTSPYYVDSSITYRFAIGALNGNYTEVGIGWANNALFSRALITPDGVTPGALTVLGDEQLDVSYLLRIYPFSESDFGAGTVEISGSSYDIVGRLANATANYGNYTPLGNDMRPMSAPSPGLTAYAGTIGGVTGTPSGGDWGSVGSAPGTYADGSLTRTSSAQFGLNAANPPGGIRSVLTNPSYSGIMYAYQYQFTPAIPKDNTKTLTLSFSCSWGRRP